VAALWAEVVDRLAECERVELIVADDASEDAARERLGRLCRRDGPVRLHRWPAAEPWCRDSGPLFLARSRSDGANELAVVSWRFNAWGRRLNGFELDDALPRRIAKQLGLPLFEPPLVLEPGAIDSNGAGTLLAAEASLLNPNRNPGVSRAEFEQALRAYLSVRHVVWLAGSIAGDDTDGHVDNMARFIAPDTILAAYERDNGDANYAVLAENIERLEHAKDQSGRPLQVVRMTMPEPVLAEDGDRLPASYLNFYIVNGAVLMPAFGSDCDRAAAELLRSMFPDRRIVPIPCRTALWGGGALHCMTQPQPA